MDNSGTTAVSLITEDTIHTKVSMKYALAHNKMAKRIAFLVVILFLVSLWFGSIVFKNGNRGIKDTVFWNDDKMNEDGNDSDMIENYYDNDGDDWEDDDENYINDEDEDYDDGEGGDYDDVGGKEYEEDENDEYEDDEDEEYENNNDDDEYEDDEDEEYEDEEEEYEEEYEEEEEGVDDDDGGVDMNMIEAALMEDDDRIIDEAVQEPPENPSDSQQSHKVARSVEQEIDFSILVGDKDWAKENAVPQNRFDLRQKLMEERCQTADTSKESLAIIKTNKIGIFFKQKASACLVNKSGSTTWRSHLRRVNRARSIYQQMDNRWKAFMSQPNLSKAMSETSRIITVRHPLTRLVSAYRQRFNNGKPVPLSVWNRRMKQHVKKYFSNYWLPAIISNNVIPAEERKTLGIPYKHTVGKIYSATLLKKVHQRVGSGFSITFPMFLRHVIYTHKHNIVDNHWKPIDWLCSPCLLHYEHIVKLETMTEDVKHVFDKLNIPSNAEMKKNKESYGQDPWVDLKRYEGVPLDLKKDIISLYWNDFYLFGYKLPPGFLKK